MNAKRKSLPKIAQRECSGGYVYTYDSNGRLCLDTEAPERVVLVHDLRVYGPGLHIGALGWTIPETTDGYKSVRIEFDTGQKLWLKRYAFERVVADSESQVVDELLSRYANTRFDCDSEVAARCREKWIASNYGGSLNLNSVVHGGLGDQELYAYTFPTLRELATLKGDSAFPVKVGYTKNASDGSYGRIRSQISEKAAYPERPEVLIIWRTWDGRNLETQVHKQLRDKERKLPESLGSEWFITSSEELMHIIGQCHLSDLPKDRVITGADETVAEGFAELMSDGATIEMGMVPGEAAVRIGIRYPDKKAEP